jgi:hypothetical protein
MDQDRTAKILPFVRPGSQPVHPRLPLMAARSHIAWHRRPGFWLAWWLMAWVVAVSRLRLATVDREVFGFEATFAFLIAIVLPLMAAPRLLEIARDVLARLRERTAADGGKPERRSA